MASVTNRDDFKEYCLKNKYSNWYFSIVENALSRGWSKKSAPVYVESHHIIPQSIYKNNDTVLLTAREHFICHLLLQKMLVGKDQWKMQRAFWNMAHTRKIKIHSKLYESIRTEYSKNCSIFMSGENNPCFGSIRKGKYKHTQEHKDYMKFLMLGKNNPMYGKEYPKHLVEQRSRNYTFVYNNKKIEVFNLRKFCRDNNLDQGAMTRVNTEKQIQHKGYYKWQK
jgi:hypothetical protein